MKTFVLVNIGEPVRSGDEIWSPAVGGWIPIFFKDISEFMGLEKDKPVFHKNWPPVRRELAKRGNTKSARCEFHEWLRLGKQHTGFVTCPYCSKPL